MSRRPVFACGRLGALVLVASLTVAGWPGASGVRIAMWRQRCSARPTRDGSHARMRAEIGGWRSLMTTLSPIVLRHSRLRCCGPG
jgi:hypothetical protein